MSVCLECLRKHSDWKECPIKAADYYPMADLVWCRRQVEWLIKNVLAYDSYPPDPVGTGYIDAPLSHKAPSSHAPFESFEILKSELRARLDKTGTSGKLLVRQVWLDEYLEQEARDALNYVCGWRRKKQNYITWLWERDHRKKSGKSRFIPLTERI